MSRDRKLPPHEAWDAVERTALAEEAERVAKLSDEALDGELEKRFLNPKRVRERGAALAEQLASRASMAARGERAKEDAPARVHTRWWAVSMASAAVVAGVALVAMNAGTVVAWFRPTPIGRDVTADAALANAPSQRARDLREQAFRACEDGLWADCERELNEAKGLDPAGDTAPRVVQARKAAYDAQHAEPTDAQPTETQPTSPAPSKPLRKPPPQPPEPDRPLK